MSGLDEEERPNFLQEAWSRYVLLRPGMDFDELRNSTKLRTAKAWSWEDRTPGTARTVYFSVAVISLFALPVFLTNPAVITFLLETAALSREGITPGEFWSDVLANPAGFLSDLFANLFERPAL